MKKLKSRYGLIILVFELTAKPLESECYSRNTNMAMDIILKICPVTETVKSLRLPEGGY